MQRQLVGFGALTVYLGTCELNCVTNFSNVLFTAVVEGALYYESRQYCIIALTPCPAHVILSRT